MDRERREAIAKALYIAGMTVISAVAAVVLLVFLMAVRIADG